jgi:phage-related minor tail protein
MAETVSGLNIKLTLDGKDLDNELKDINKELKVLENGINSL